jgi:DNA polymerase III alpha subunit
MSNIIALFHDHSSRRGILTYWKESECIEGGPQSILKLAKEANLKEVFGISNNLHTFFEAYRNLKEQNISFRFGLSLIMCKDVNDKTEDSLKTEHKIIVWAKNSQAYKDLIKIYTKCHADINNKYYIQRFDFNQLNALWTNNLILSIPFFDSFIHKNLLQYGSNIIPQFPVQPIIFREQNSGLPFENLINNALDNYNKDKSMEEIRCKTIYYENKDDARAYITYRALDNRASFNSPGIDFLCSNNFSFQDYKELIK